MNEPATILPILEQLEKLLDHAEHPQTIPPEELAKMPDTWLQAVAQLTTLTEDPVQRTLAKPYAKRLEQVIKRVPPAVARIVQYQSDLAQHMISENRRSQQYRSNLACDIGQPFDKSWQA